MVSDCRNVHTCQLLPLLHLVLTYLLQQRPCTLVVWHACKCCSHEVSTIVLLQRLLL
jgi:hypothetical protein